MSLKYINKLPSHFETWQSLWAYAKDQPGVKEATSINVTLTFIMNGLHCSTYSFDMDYVKARCFDEIMEVRTRIGKTTEHPAYPLTPDEAYLIPPTI